MLQFQRVNYIFLTSDQNLILCRRPRNCCSGNNTALFQVNNIFSHEHKLTQNCKCARCGQHGFHHDNVKIICTVVFINIYTVQNLSNIIIKLINYYQQIHYIAIKITQITVRHHTRHNQYTQLRYAATHRAINAFTFNRILSTYYILLYDLVSTLNFKAT